MFLHAEGDDNEAFRVVFKIPARLTVSTSNQCKVNNNYLSTFVSHALFPLFECSQKNQM